MPFLSIYGDALYKSTFNLLTLFEELKEFDAASFTARMPWQQRVNLDYEEDTRVSK